RARDGRSPGRDQEGSGDLTLLAVTPGPKCGSTKIENDECLHCGIIISKYVAYLAHQQAATAPPAASPPPTAPSAHMERVDFKIQGDDMQYVEVALNPGATAVAEAGAMMYAESGIELTTMLGDGSQQGALGKVWGAVKRGLANESLFITAFTNRDPAIRHV